MFIYECWQKKLKSTKFTVKYEKKIEELTMQCQRKTDECYEAWMSLTTANEQLEKVRMELDNRLFQTYSLGKLTNSVYWILVFKKQSLLFYPNRKRICGWRTFAKDITKICYNYILRSVTVLSQNSTSKMQIMPNSHIGKSPYQWPWISIMRKVIVG